MLEKYTLLKAMKAVLADPEKRFSVRGMAKEADLSPGSARVCFKYMKERGIVKSEGKVGRAFQFHADLDNALAREWKRVFAVDILLREGIVDVILKSLGDGVMSVVMYGSMAKGTYDEKSDVDILVVAGGSKKRISFSNIEAKIKREINLSIYTPAEWREKAKNDKVFYEQVIFDSIELFGEKLVVL